MMESLYITYDFTDTYNPRIGFIPSDPSAGALIVEKLFFAIFLSIAGFSLITCFTVFIVIKIKKSRRGNINFLADDNDE